MNYWELKFSRSIATGLLIGLLLITGCAQKQLQIENGQRVVSQEFVLNKQIGEGIKGVVVPHHLLVKDFMDKFYALLAEKNHYDEIIIISPNHFGYGQHFLQTSDVIEGHKLKLDQAGIDELVASGKIAKEPKHFKEEHGVWSEEKFVNKYFPEALVIPIIVKRDTPQIQLEALADELIKYKKEKVKLNILILASLDFSHYSAEELAVQNDLRMVDWMAKWKSFPEEMMFKSALQMGISGDKSNAEAVAIDSPEALYLFAELMRKMESTDFALWQRTSTASLVGGTDPLTNTSHIFASFK